MKFKDFKKLHVKEVVDLMTNKDVDLIYEIEKETKDDLEYSFYAESYMNVIDLAKYKDNEEIFTITEYLEDYLEYILTLKSINE